MQGGAMAVTPGQACDLMEFSRPKCRVYLVVWFVFIRTCFFVLFTILFLETCQCKFQCNWV
jgi:hypothetical protein